MSLLKIQRKVWLALALVCCLAGSAISVQAAPAQDANKLFAQASALIKQEKYAPALPLLEKVVKAQPKNARAYFYLGFSLLVTAEDLPEAQRKARRVRARNAWIRSKQLGIREPNVDALIANVPADGSPSPNARPFSKNPQANRLMMAAEDFYTSGKLDDALANYQQALRLDPNIYEAALFSGDVYLHRNDFPNAEVWYQKAIDIDPSRETAYRYSATPLMKQGKYEEGRDRYIEAYITEPYNRFTGGGLRQWAMTTNYQLKNPAIPIPVKISYNAKGAAQITVEVQAGKNKTDGTFAWLAYGPARAEWHNGKFAKAFPRAKTYRHSLAEEAYALRTVLKIAGEEKSVTNLDLNLAKLKKLDEEGLLEAFILLTRADEGIAEDHPAYLRDHRDQLRKFMMDYVIGAE